MVYKQKNKFDLSKNYIRHYSLARHALYSVLRKINPKEDSYILLPSLICKEFIIPINKLNLNIKFYDLDKNLNPINLKVNNKISILLIINYFGFPFNFSRIKHECEKLGIIIIEDNSHGLFSSDKKINLGRRGDFGIDNYRKSLPCIDGAILICNNHTYINILPKQLKIELNLKSIKYFFIFLVNEFFLSSFRRFLKNLLFKKNKKIDINEYFSNPIGPDFFSILIYKLTRSNNEIKRRRYLYTKYTRLIKEFGGKPVFKYLPSWVSPYCLPFYLNSNNYNLQNIISADGYKIYRWPNLPDIVLSDCPAYYKNLWMINFKE